MNSVFLRDSTAVSDSVLLLFGGSFSKGDIVSILVLDVFCFLYKCYNAIESCFGRMDT